MNIRSESARSKAGDVVLSTADGLKLVKDIYDSVKDAPGKLVDLAIDQVRNLGHWLKGDTGQFRPMLSSWCAGCRRRALRAQCLCRASRCPRHGWAALWPAISARSSDSRRESAATRGLRSGCAAPAIRRRPPRRALRPSRARCARGRAPRGRCPSRGGGTSEPGAPEGRCPPSGPDRARRGQGAAGLLRGLSWLSATGWAHR